MPVNERQMIILPSKHLALSTRQRGQSLVETLAGIAILIPLALFSIDLTAMITSNQTNERIAEDAARAAANQQTALLAQQAAQMAIDDFHISPPIKKVSIQNFVYDPAGGQVAVTTQVEISLPISFSFAGKMQLNTQAVQPIVGLPAPI